MKKKSFVYLILSLVIALGACNEPVFYIISVEPPIFKPLIEGSPANFVVFDDKLYTASGRSIYSYDGKSWSLIPAQPGGKILQLAATDTYLYALCLEGSADYTTLKRIDNSGAWKPVTGDTIDNYNMLQSVYAAQDKVFIGAERNNSFVVLYIDEATDSSFKPLKGTAEEPVDMLCGLAYDNSNYYLCTRGSVIFVTPKAVAPETVTPRDSENVRFAGIINLGINDIIVAISRDGSLYYVDTTGITKVPNVSLGDRPSTGALAVWRETDGAPRLLLAGRQDRLNYSVTSGYTYGYLELELDSGGIAADKNFAEPGKSSPSSVADNERYVSTIGKYPVNHIFQAPAEIDPNMTLFASTHKNGIWSYKERNGIPQWNAED